jgi:2-polyprenyl-3-methyl-5-hydroxy-6-metoxy-1,4-benzoquinol methylase
MQAQRQTTEKPDSYLWVKQDCPICNTEPTKFMGKRGGAAHRENLGVETEIWSCRKCELIFPNPMPLPVGGLSQHYDVEADDYFAAHDKQKKLESAAKLIAQAEEILGRTGRLLDVGVGRGEILIAAKDLGWVIEGVEPSEMFAEYAEKRIGAKVWRKPIEECDLPECEYDVVILSAVLEHLYNPDEVIKNISRALKSGGLLYLDVPNEKGLFFKVGNLYQKIRRRDWCVNLAPTFSPFHIFGFSPKPLRALLKKYGFEPKVWTVYGGTSLVSSKGGVTGLIESYASQLVTAISNLGEMGTYIETWAVKK